jgi:hypothetical protein
VTKYQNIGELIRHAYYTQITSICKKISVHAHQGTNLTFCCNDGDKAGGNELGNIPRYFGIRVSSRKYTTQLFNLQIKMKNLLEYIPQYVHQGKLHVI